MEEWCNQLLHYKSTNPLVIDFPFLYNKFAANYPNTDFLKGGGLTGDSY
jgi:hypothetical protein